MMKSMGICNEIIKSIVYDIIEKMYEKTRCAVAVDEHITEWFLASEDARQSFLPSPRMNWNACSKISHLIMNWTLV